MIFAHYSFYRFLWILTNLTRFKQISSILPNFYQLWPIFNNCLNVQNILFLLQTRPLYCAVGLARSSLLSDSVILSTVLSIVTSWLTVVLPNQCWKSHGIKQHRIGAVACPVYMALWLSDWRTGWLAVLLLLRQMFSWNNIFTWIGMNN